MCHRHLSEPVHQGGKKSILDGGASGAIGFGCTHYKGEITICKPRKSGNPASQEFSDSVVDTIEVSDQLRCPKYLSQGFFNSP